MALMFPNIDPVMFDLGTLSLGGFSIPFVIRWYAMAYIVGLLGGLFYAHRLIANPSLWKDRQAPLTKAHLEDLFVWVAFGVILGGRLGYVLFYKFSYYLSHPGQIFTVWEGGMSFHGGCLGVGLALVGIAYWYKLPVLALADVIAAVVPIGLGLGRMANFINAELYGRVTDVAWAIRFPIHPALGGGFTQPRHPSQIYEGMLEGLVLFCILAFAIYNKKSLREQGKVAGLFLIFYGLFRSFCELFREPDVFLGFVFPIGQGGLTQGMILSVPMVICGIYLWNRKTNVLTEDNKA